MIACTGIHRQAFGWVTSEAFPQHGSCHTRLLGLFASYLVRQSNRDMLVYVEDKGVTMPDIVDLLRSRRSVRAYEDRPVAPELLRRLLVAAMAAPSASNSQPWEFVVITRPAILERLRSKLLFARYNAPAAIAVCANLRIAHNSAAQHYWVQDCSAATQNILIAAAGLGLGSVWIGVYPLPSVMAPVRQVLALPEDVTPLSLVYVGHPTEHEPPNGHDRYEERRVYWEQYEPRKRRARKKNAKHE